MSVDYSPAAVSARLREVARRSDLTAENRLAYKIDMSAEAISRRLRIVSNLRRDCLALVRLGEANGLGRAEPSIPRLRRSEGSVRFASCDGSLEERSEPGPFRTV